MEWFWILVAVLVFLIYYWGARPYLAKRMLTGKIINPVRTAYIKQTKKMIQNYNIDKDELFDEE